MSQQLGLPPGLRRGLLVVGCGLVAGVAVLWNLRGSPDTLYDEVVYTRAAQRVAQGWDLTWSTQPLFVHPPLSFLAEAGWLHLFGRADAPLADVVATTRLLAGLATVAGILVLALLASQLMPHAAGRRKTLLIVVVTVLAATDPILLRYGRVALIEPFALLGCLGTLYLAIRLRNHAAVFVPAVGLAAGLTLLTKELSVVLLLTPLGYAVLDRDWRLTRRTAAALLTGFGFWLLFPLWAIQLGLGSNFFYQKTVMLQRLAGAIQNTGWNRPGVSSMSLVSAVLGQTSQYMTSYLLLGGGALALLWLFMHRLSSCARWLRVWLLNSYAFGAYAVLLGTFNEHFFFYLMPAAIVGSVLVGDAVVANRVAKLRAAGAEAFRKPVATVLASGAALLTLAGFAAASWAQFYLPRNDGVFRSVAFIRSHLPACSAVNQAGDPATYAHLLPDHTVTDHTIGPAALSHGVHLFLLSGRDAGLSRGNVTPELTSWVRARGAQLASFPSAQYRGLELWRVPADPFDPLADIEPVPGGYFVITEGSRCGGFAVLNGPAGNFAAGWTSLGGKAVTGPPCTASWTTDGLAHQVFAGVVLTASGDSEPIPLPIVPTLAAQAPDIYRAAQLPPVTELPGRPPLTTDEVLARLTDPAIASAYLDIGAPEPAAIGRTGVPVPAWTGIERIRAAQPAPGGIDRSRALLGDPVGPPTHLPDGTIRQAFAGTVLERAANSTHVRMSPVGSLAIKTHVVVPATEARHAGSPPPPPDVLEPLPPEPTTVKPFLQSLGAALAIYAGATGLIVLFSPNPRLRAAARRWPGAN